MTLTELAGALTAQEFGLRAELARVEPLGAWAPALQHVLAAIANGELQPPPGRKVWAASDFGAPHWAQHAAPPVAPAPAQALTAKEILAAAQAVGMGKHANQS